MGRIDHYTLQDWASRILPDSGDVVAVRMRRLSYDELGGDRFDVFGVADVAMDLEVKRGDALAPGLPALGGAAVAGTPT